MLIIKHKKLIKINVNCLIYETNKGIMLIFKLKKLIKL